MLLASINCSERGEFEGDYVVRNRYIIRFIMEN